MNEFGLIDKYFNVKPTAPRCGTVVAIGDDCAVIKPSQKNIAVSVDTCIESVHFLKSAPANFVAKRALRTALSDLAAIGAQANWVTLALTLPALNESWLTAFSQGFHEDLAHFGCELIGGDTTRGPLSITVQVMGEIPKRQTLRSGAQVGDGIYVTNTLGNGAASLYCLKNQPANCVEKEKQLTHYAQSHFYMPELTFSEAAEINAIATSAIDISDGLLADVSHICKQSLVAAHIDLQRLPYSRQAELLADIAVKNDASNIMQALLLNTKSNNKEQHVLACWALLGGDDYQLCFTAPKEKMHSIQKQSQKKYTCIGAIKAGNSVHVSYQGEAVELAQMKNGYSHF